MYFKLGGFPCSSKVIEMIVQIQTVNLIGYISHVEPIEGSAGRVRNPDMRTKIPDS